jgi:AraC-like DNA-binding protein
MRNLDFEVECQTGASSSRLAGQDGGMATENCQRIEKTIRYMAQHLNQPLQASELAALANISLSHYFAIFKRTTGCAPIDFFIRLRMKRASQLLETTSMNVKEIAGQLGYEDPFYFSRLFKSVSGVAPSDYRKARKDVGADPSNARLESFSAPVRNELQRNAFVPAKGTRSSLSMPFEGSQFSATRL